jgi:hypothetical protein
LASTINADWHSVPSVWYAFALTGFLVKFGVASLLLSETRLVLPLVMNISSTSLHFQIQFNVFYEHLHILLHVGTIIVGGFSRLLEHSFSSIDEVIQVSRPQNFPGPTFLKPPNQGFSSTLILYLELSNTILDPSSLDGGLPVSVVGGHQNT